MKFRDRDSTSARDKTCVYHFLFVLEGEKNLNRESHSVILDILCNTLESAKLK